MRILVHDYSGHPFQVQLSRGLARRGHDVLHVHCSSYETGKGAVEVCEDDPASLHIVAIELGRTFDRYAMHRRVYQEILYGGRFTRIAASYGPDVVISSNDPLLAKTRAAFWSFRTHTPWVFWLQDVYSIAMKNYAEQRLGPVGRGLGSLMEATERRLAHAATGVVQISDDFSPILRRWNVPEERCSVIENWAPIDELPTRLKDNAWSREFGLHDKEVFLYAGTLGLKHDPSALVEVAERYRADPRLRVVVVSQGSGADWLTREKESRHLENILVLPYQDFSRLPDVLGSADVLVALLSSDAGVFSVPSKILSYLCAGRAILAAIPEDNLAARTIRRAEAGIVVRCDSPEAFLAGAEHLRDAAKREVLGANARAYAEASFDLDGIVDRFESIIAAAGRRHVSRAGIEE